jgi:hypothetical protein
MADKKVERNLRSSDQERPQTPTQKMTGALSDSGNVNMAEADRDKGKTALLDRFRDRDERYRREQSIAAIAENAPAGPASSDAPAEVREEDEGSDTPSD